MTIIRGKLILSGLLFYLFVAPAKAENILVFAAASLTAPLQEIADTYETRSNDKIRISFAASSALARQISKGAPASLYISANLKWMSFLEDQGLIVGKSRRDLLINRLVLIAPGTDRPAINELTPKTMELLLSDRRLAIADPAHVPAGIYGVQALKSLNLWTVTRDRLAPMLNVRAALALVERGETRAGIVYATDAHANARVKRLFTFPAKSHDPIVYPSALVGQKNTETARRFYQSLSGPAAKSIFTRHGFLVK